MKKFFSIIFAITFFSTQITTLKPISQTAVKIYSAIGAGCAAGAAMFCISECTNDADKYSLVVPITGAIVGGLLRYKLSSYTPEAKTDTAENFINTFSKEKSNDLQLSNLDLAKNLLDSAEEETSSVELKKKIGSLRSQMASLRSSN